MKITPCFLLDTSHVPLIPEGQRPIIGLYRVSKPDLKADFIDISAESSLEAKNRLLESIEGYVLYLEPWETLTEPISALFDRVVWGKDGYRLNILTDRSIRKEVRLFDTKKARFANFAFETVNLTGSVGFIDYTVLSETPQWHLEAQKQRLEAWEGSNRGLSTPLYYKSFIFYSNGDYLGFIREAEKYVLLHPSGVAAVMLLYQMAYVYLYHLGESDRAYRAIVRCLAVNGQMSEFWCLLGDIHFQAGSIGDAVGYYRKAIEMGKGRLTSDEWPVDLTRYFDYPEKMIGRCEGLLSSRKLIVTQ